MIPLPAKQECCQSHAVEFSGVPIPGWQFRIGNSGLAIQVGNKVAAKLLNE
jgi:hypothetical protein